MKFTILALLLPAFLACSRPLPQPQVPQPSPVCQLNPPPTSDPVAFAAQGASPCPAPYDVCLLPNDARALARNVEALQRYAADAFTRCGQSK